MQELEFKTQDTDQVINLGNAAELTLGEGTARNENKRNPYN